MIPNCHVCRDANVKGHDHGRVSFAPAISKITVSKAGWQSPVTARVFFHVNSN